MNKIAGRLITQPNIHTRNGKLTSKVIAGIMDGNGKIYKLFIDGFLTGVSDFYIPTN